MSVTRQHSRNHGPCIVASVLCLLENVSAMPLGLEQPRTAIHIVLRLTRVSFLSQTQLSLSPPLDYPVSCRCHFLDSRFQSLT